MNDYDVCVPGNSHSLMERRFLLQLIQLSLWGVGVASADREIFEEMKKQAVALLPGRCLSSLGLPEDLRQEWQRYSLQQLTYNIQNKFEQENLPINVPYVILKGTSAAMYYPHPEYRTLGDIDIITRREDFDTALQEMKDAGYQIIKDLNREISLRKKNIIIELHKRFASLNDAKQAEYLDMLIFESINPSHILPDPINGLVLLEHIGQHLEVGIGLRQIIDWMMFVDKRLSDEEWPAFQEMAEKVGLVTLASVCTKMCIKYLGLSERKWCSNADDTLCDQLMQYVLNSGNFGIKKRSDEDISINILSYGSTPKTFFSLLQQQGTTNWRAAREHKILRPFAWVYQAGRYVHRGMRRDQAFTKLREEYAQAKKRTRMFDALGVKTAAKGIVIYKDGKYVKR